MRPDSKPIQEAGEEIIDWYKARGRNPKDKLFLAGTLGHDDDRRVPTAGVSAPDRLADGIEIERLLGHEDDGGAARDA